MAGPCTYCNLIPTGKNKFIRETLTNGNNTSTFAASKAQIPALTKVSSLALTFPLAQIPVSAPGSPGRYTNKNLQKNIKLALELFV